MNKIKCIAFDCFGTVFDMSGISHDEIKAYANHVRSENFSPFEFPHAWWLLKAHPDSEEGINQLNAHGYKCVALSNGGKDLIKHLSFTNRINWFHIVDLVAHEVYKPHIDAYRTVEKDLGFKPEETLMVTANPTFGDIEGALSIGMEAQIIRNGYPDILGLFDVLKEIDK